MPLLIRDEEMSDMSIAERQASGMNRYHEVWEGVDVMAPLANIEHHQLG